MSSTALQLDRLDAALYLRASERTDCCQGCRSSTVSTDKTGRESMTCAASRGGIVARLGICAKWREKMRPKVPA